MSLKKSHVLTHRPARAARRGDRKAGNVEAAMLGPDGGTTRMTGGSVCAFGPTGKVRALCLGALAAVLLIVGLLSAPVAPAKAANLPGITTGFLDDKLFTSPDAEVRDAWFFRTKATGAGIVRINVNWRSVVAPTPPQNPTDPADPAYDLSQIDGAVQSARASGLDVLLTVYWAPDWAEGPDRPANVRPGSWKPDPQAYGEFGQMLATRYSGNFEGLPRVSKFEAWVEPNLSNYLSPQWVGRTPVSPKLYRRLLNALYAGVKGVQPFARVFGGSTAPIGDDPTVSPIPELPRTRPLIFLRKLLCLTPTLKPTNCPEKPRLDNLSHHPVNLIFPPGIDPPPPDQVMVAGMHRIREALDAARSAGTVLPPGPKLLWASEMWWFTKPPNSSGVPVEKHARWMEQALYLLWKQGVRGAINLEVGDPPYDPSQPGNQQWTTGVFFADGTKKPAFTAWRFPFVTERISSTSAWVRVWGKAPVSGRLNIQRKVATGWQTLKRIDVKAGAVFQSLVKRPRSATLRGRIGYTTSLTWFQR